MLKSKFAGSLILFACAALLCGCGDSGTATIYQVSGKVIYSDGSPVTSGMVIFSSGKVEALADIKKDGTFTLKSAVGGKSVDGAPAGNYRVHIVNGGGEDLNIDSKEKTVEKEGENTTPDSDAAPPEIVAEKFRSPDTSEISVEVSADNKSVTIKVEKP